MPIVLMTRCASCGELVVPVRSGETPRRTTMPWLLSCPNCKCEYLYPTGTLLEPVRTPDSRDESSRSTANDAPNGLPCPRCSSDYTESLPVSDLTEYTHCCHNCHHVGRKEDPRGGMS